MKTQRGRNPPTRHLFRRVPAWPAGSQGALVAAVVVLVVGAAVFDLSGAGSDHLRTVAGDLAPLPVGGAAVALAFVAAHDRAVDARSRRAWTRLGLAFGCWVLGDVLWAWLEVVRHTSPFPSAADFCYLSFYPLFLVGVLSFPAAPQRRLERFKLSLDAAIVVVGGALAVWYLAIAPVLRGGDSGLAEALSIAYPVGDLLLLLGIGTLLVRDAPPVSTPALRALGCAAALFVVADVGYARLNLAGTYTSGDWPDVGWLAALAMLVVAAHWQRRAAAIGASAEVVAPPVRPVSRLPYVAIAVATALVFSAAGRVGDTGLVALIAGSTLLTGLVVARQITALRENAQLVAELHQLAATDGLTGLRTRRSFLQTAERHWADAVRRDQDVTAVMIDIDHFKRINDDNGHAVGDEVLTAVAAVCVGAVRAGDLIGRFGGDEIMLLLPGVGADAAEAIVARIDGRLAAPVRTDVGDVPVTVSIGVATRDATTPDLRTLLKYADFALYEAKQRGRCQARVWAGVGAEMRRCEVRAG